MPSGGQNKIIFNRAIVKRIVKLALEGVSTKKIPSLLGLSCSHQVIRRILKEQDIDISRSSLTERQVKEIVRLYQDEKLLIKEIATKFNRSISTIGYHLKKESIKTRKYDIGGYHRKNVPLKIQKQIVKKFKDNKTYPEIASEIDLHLSRAIIKRILKENDVYEKRLEISEPFIKRLGENEATKLLEKAERIYLEGKGSNQNANVVAERLGIPPDTFRDFLRERGTARTQSEASALTAQRIPFKFGYGSGRLVVIRIKNRTKNNKYELAHGSYEAVYMNQLNSNHDVEYWTKNHGIIIRLKGGRSYIPDFLITMNDGKQFLVEVKPKDFLNTDENKKKIRAGRKYAKKHKMIFKIITEDQLGKDNIDRFVRQNHPLYEEIDTDAIIQEYRSGTNMQMLRAKYHVDFNFIQEVLLDLPNLKERLKIGKRKRAKEAFQLYKKGLSREEIAKTLNLHPGTLDHYRTQFQWAEKTNYRFIKTFAGKYARLPKGCRNLVTEDLKNGMDIKSIAIKYNVDGSTVREIEKTVLPKKQQRGQQVQNEYNQRVNEAFSLYKKGLSRKQIASELNLHLSTIDAYNSRFKWAERTHFKFYRSFSGKHARLPEGLKQLILKEILINDSDISIAKKFNVSKTTIQHYRKAPRKR